jgi:hypothetical protein
MVETRAPETKIMLEEQNMDIDISAQGHPGYDEMWLSIEATCPGFRMWSTVNDEESARELLDDLEKAIETISNNGVWNADAEESGAAD